jgi:hypothetical protein
VCVFANPVLLSGICSSCVCGRRELSTFFFIRLQLFANSHVLFKNSSCVYAQSRDTRNICTMSMCMHKPWPWLKPVLFSPIGPRNNIQSLSKRHESTLPVKKPARYLVRTSKSACSCETFFAADCRLNAEQQETKKKKRKQGGEASKSPSTDIHTKSLFF